MRISTKVAYNTIVQIISKAVATILGLFAIALITRYLGQAGFGQYTTIITFLSFFAILADFGLTLVTVQMISDPRVNTSKVLNNLFSLRLVSAVVFLGLAPLVVLFLPYDPIVKIGVAITTFLFLFTALNQILVGLFQKELRMDKVSIAEVASRFILLIGVYIAIKLNFGLLGILVINILANLVSFIIHFIFSRGFARIKLDFDLKIWKEIIKRSWPLALTISFNLIYLKADTLILSLIKTQAEVGIYGAAYKVIDVLTTIPFMFAGIVLPILTYNWIEKNREAFDKVLQRSFNLMAIIAIPLIVGTQFIGEEIMVMVAGNEFSISGHVLKILIVAAALIYLGVMFAHAIIAMDKQKAIIKAYIFTSITALAGYLVFIPKYSYIGAACVTIYSELVIALASIYYVWKFSKFIPDLQIVGKSLVASSFMGVCIYLLPKSAFSSNFKLLGVIFFACIIYFVLLASFRGITKKDIMDLLNK